jgi:hypothetical protein
VLDIIRKVIEVGQVYCCFLDIPAFVLFQCFSTFQHPGLAGPTPSKPDNCIINTPSQLACVAWTVFLQPLPHGSVFAFLSYQNFCCFASHLASERLILC